MDRVLHGHTGLEMFRQPPPIRNKPYLFTVCFLFFGGGHPTSQLGFG